MFERLNFVLQIRITNYRSEAGTRIKFLVESDMQRLLVFIGNSLQTCIINSSKALKT